jgi:tetratricopeptide (TPR) repeat protein
MLEATPEQGFDRALAAHRLGRYAEAAGFYREVIALDPSHADAISLLGALALQQSQADAAILYIGRAIHIAPSGAPYHSNLGSALRSQGRFAEAADAFERAARLKSDFVDAYVNLAIARLDLGLKEQSAGTFRAALVVSPANYTALAGLGSALEATAQNTLALAAYRHAATARVDWVAPYVNVSNLLNSLSRPGESAAAAKIACCLDPALPDAYFGRGKALSLLGRRAEAVQELKIVSQLAPGNIEVRHAISGALRDSDDVLGAIVAAQAAAAIDPTSADSYSALGLAYHEQWNPALARTNFERALAITPRAVDALTNLGNALKGMRLYDEAMAAYEGACAFADERNALPEMNRATLLMELGRTGDALDAVEAALKIDRCAARAWYLRSELTSFADAPDEITQMEKLLAGLNEGEATREDRTLLRFALGKAWMEAGNWQRAFTHLEAGNRLKRETFDYDADAADNWLRAIAGAVTPDLIARFDHRQRGATVAPIFVVGMPRSGTTLIEQILATHSEIFGAGELPLMQDAIDRLVADRGGRLAYPDRLASLTEAEAEEIGRYYLAGIDALSSQMHVIDKMPTNFLHVGLIHLALPDARIIHCRRDPVDTCISCFTKRFVGEHLFAYDLYELGRFYRTYESLMAHWRELLPSDKFIEVRYEDVVADLEGEARRLVDFCGLDWQEACLTFHKTDRVVSTASVNQVRRPIYGSSIGRPRPPDWMMERLLLGLDGR